MIRPYSDSYLRRAGCVLLAGIAMVLTIVVATPAFAQDEPVVVTHGGYGAFAGQLGFSLSIATAGALARVIYANPIGVDCGAEPQRCRKTALEHVLVGTVFLGAIGATIAAGYGGQKFAEHRDWNPVTGWALSGGSIALPATLLLQSGIPQWKPEWTRMSVGLALGAGGAVAGGYAFSAISRRRGHAWPEYGFGAGGMLTGLALGAIIAPDTVWIPVLGGLGGFLGASVAALAF